MTLQNLTSSNVVDLTAEEDEFTRIDNLSSAASRAEAAASRLVESLTALSKPNVFKSAPRLEPTQVSLKTSAETNGLSMGREAGSVPALATGPVSGVNEVSSPVIPKFVEGSLPQDSQLINEVTAPVRANRPTTPRVESPNSRAATSRVPRAAALSAGKNISETYDILNPLEAQHEATVSTPKKRGRPPKDEYTPKWTPTSTGKSGQNGQVHSKKSPTPTPLRSNVQIENRERDVSSLRMTEDLSPQRKRRRSSTLPSLGSFSNIENVCDPNQSVTRAVSQEQPFNSASLSVMPQGNIAITSLIQSSSRVSEQSAQAGQAHSENDVLAQLLAAQTATDGNLKKLLNLVASGGATPEQLEELKGHIERIRSKDILTQLLVAQTATDQNLKKLLNLVASGKASPEQLEELKEHMERLRNRHTPHQENRHVNGVISQTAGRSNSTVITADKTGLRSTDHEKSNISLNQSSRSSSSVEKDQLRLLKSLARSPNAQAAETSSGEVLTTQSQSSPGEQFAPDESFPPGFDRGRFPAQRRRRGNKFYTPSSRISSLNITPQTSSLVLPSQLSQNLKKQFQDEHSPSDCSSSDGDHMMQPNLSQKTLPKMKKAKLDLRSNQQLTNGEFAKRLLAKISEMPPSASPQSVPVAVNEQSAKEEISKERGRRLLASLSDVVIPEESFSAGPGSHVNTPLDVSSLTSLTDFQDLKSMTPTTFPMQSQKLASTEIIAPITQSERKQIPLLRAPATAFDPHLERAVAVAVSSDSEVHQSAPEETHYIITKSDQLKLLETDCVLKYTGKRKLIRIESKMVDPVRRSQRSFATLLRHRELGLGSLPYTNNEIRARRSEMIEKWKYWKGASGDVVAAAWAADSNTYAVGAATHLNAEDIQYNRPCNLLLGRLESNKLIELPDHRVDRPKPETIDRGPNSSQAVYDACDPMLYTTVSSIAFTPTGSTMYTASHDRTVRIWNVLPGQHQCLRVLRHQARVTSVEASACRPGVFATGQQTIDKSVRVYQQENLEENPTYTPFSSRRAQAKPNNQIFPECLRWGVLPYTSHLLLSGFSQWEGHKEGQVPSDGQLFLWDADASQEIKVAPSSQSVFAAAWHPIEPFFATGGAPGSDRNLTDRYRTKTVVRTWDLRTPKRMTMEYECTAKDMQDITFHPTDSHIVTACCTDGTTYVWDYRCYQEPLHRLRHGLPLIDWDHTKRREDADTGVMMSLWMPSSSLLYTGSSDGMIKAWDVRRSCEDVLDKDVAQLNAGVMSGAFSPDGTNLLVGDADGGVHMLTSASCAPRPERESDEASIELVRAPDGSGLTINRDDDDPGTEGQKAAKALIDSGQMMYDAEYGVSQGHRYNGPWATHLREGVTDPGAGQVGRLPKSVRKQLAFGRNGKRHDKIADQRQALIKGRKRNIEALAQVEEGSTFESANIKRSRRNIREPTPMRDDYDEVDAAGADFSTTSYIREDSGSMELDEMTEVINNTISESEMIEENHWWPRMGEDEIADAIAGRRPAED